MVLSRDRWTSSVCSTRIYNCATFFGSYILLRAEDALGPVIGVFDTAGNPDRADRGPISCGGFRASRQDRRCGHSG
jgi:hypothetical protein